MDKPISVGDLVQIVRPATCGCGSYLGLTFTVSRIRTVGIGANYSCICGVTGIAEQPYDVADGHPTKNGFALRVLKRIPPYNQLEHFRSEELLRRDVKEKA